MVAAGVHFASSDSLKAVKAATKEALIKHMHGANGACTSSLQIIHGATSSLNNFNHNPAPYRHLSRHSMVAAGLDFASFDSLGSAKAAAKEALTKHVDDSDGACTSSSGHILAECFEAAVEDSLQQPTFVLDFPVEISPLAKPHQSKPGLTERFELYIAGKPRLASLLIDNTLLAS